MLLTAVAIKLLSPGPVFYVQQRIGFRRQSFACYKFRTMEPNAPAVAHRNHLAALVASGAKLDKLDRTDLRVIPLGRWIRSSGLDELPQMWNIVRGEMSLVGPRPCADYELPCFPESSLARFDALPGLTGLWQISGKNDTTFAEMIQQDLRYVRHASILLDFQILANTPAVVVGQMTRLAKEMSVFPAALDKVFPASPKAFETGVSARVAHSESADVQ